MGQAESREEDDDDDLEKDDSRRLSDILVSGFCIFAPDRLEV